MRRKARSRIWSSEGRRCFSSCGKTPPPPPLIFWNHGLTGKTAVNLWKQRSYWQNIEINQLSDRYSSHSELGRNQQYSHKLRYIVKENRQDSDSDSRA